MPVQRKKKDTTTTPELATPDRSSPVLPEQQVFHQYLRRLAQSAVRIVIETVMREELDQFIGAAWGECSPKRKGYRTGVKLPEQCNHSHKAGIEIARKRCNCKHQCSEELGLNGMVSGCKHLCKRRDG